MTHYSNKRINQFSVKYFRILVVQGQRTLRAIEGQPIRFGYQREDNNTATGATDRCAGASSLPVPVMAASTVLENSLQEFYQTRTYIT